MVSPIRSRVERERVLTRHWRQIPPGVEDETVATVRI
jgi:hypothetical protein